MRNIAFVLDSFRIMHVEQFEGVAAAVGDERKVAGIELFSGNEDYPFEQRRGATFEHITLFRGEERARLGMFRGAWHILRKCRAVRAGIVFISHYERPYIFLVALMLRLSGKTVFVLQDSKFDDYRRFLWREVFKRLMYKPYQGAIVASPRSGDYVRFLGVDPARIRLNCYTTSLERVRAAAGAPPAPGGTPFAERAFLSVARLIPKKNHMMLLDAYAAYAARAAAPRRLLLCGSGPLEEEIRARINALGLDGQIVLKGNLASAEIARELAGGLCLLLPSIEEQYGIVVIEAQAMGLPVILSENCGARDTQVRTGVNGFVVESDNAGGLAYFMERLGGDEALWTEMADAACRSADRGDVAGFVESVLSLIS